MLGGEGRGGGLASDDGGDPDFLSGRRMIPALGIEAEDHGENLYAVNEGEWRADIAAVGAAVLDRGHRPIAAVSVSMPLNRYTETDHAAIGDLVMPAAARIGQLAQGAG